jgi:hypothetical protein
MSYEEPQITEYGSLTELTAMMHVGGPVDTFAESPPGHSCPTGPPLEGGTNHGDPECVGQGGGSALPGDNPANPGQGSHK